MADPKDKKKKPNGEDEFAIGPYEARHFENDANDTERPLGPNEQQDVDDLIAKLKGTAGRKPS